MKLLLFLIIFASLLEICQCCLYCPEEVPAPVAFCRSNWIARVKVISNEPIMIEEEKNVCCQVCRICNKVEYTKIYKAPAELNGTLPNEIISQTGETSICGGKSIVSDICDPRLQQDNEYLLNGEYIDGRMTILSCDKIENEEDVKIIIERQIYKFCEKILKFPASISENWREIDFDFDKMNFKIPIDGSGQDIEIPFDGSGQEIQL